MHPLSDDNKRAIFKAIRYSFLTHDELLSLMQNPEFALAKEMIMQGLSCKLNSYEVSQASDLLITLKPRDITQVMLQEG